MGFIGAPILFLVVLTPKFFWEGFNGDGAHAYESSRLLLHQAFSFWSPDAGGVANFPGLNSVLFTYPSSWFIRLFGHHEASARLPFVLYLIVLHAAVVSVARNGFGRPLGFAGHALISLGLMSFGLVMSFSTTYDPYCSDIALPATQDALLMICFLGAVLGFVRNEVGWMLLFTLFTLLASPAGPLLLGTWLLGILLGFRSRPFKKAALFAVGLVASAGLLAVLPGILGSLGLPTPGGEHDTGELLRKFRYLLFSDFGRFAFLVVPCGIYPILGVFTWRWTDDVVRALTVVILLVFGTYYLIAFVSLHYFVPVMILPLVVFWRCRQPSAWRRPRTAMALCFLAASCSVVLALPTSTSIYTATREVGASVDVGSLPGYQEMEPQFFAATRLLDRLFPYDWHQDVPERSYGGSPLAWAYYAQRAAGGDGTKNYILSRSDSLPPVGARLLATEGAASVYVRDPRLWKAHRTMRPAGSNGPAIYAISRDILFKRRRALKRYAIIDVQAWLRRLVYHDG
jgi:hypothetical protein